MGRSERWPQGECNAAQKMRRIINRRTPRPTMQSRDLTHKILEKSFRYLQKALQNPEISYPAVSKHFPVWVKMWVSQFDPHSKSLKSDKSARFSKKIGHYLARRKGFEPLTFWSVASMGEFTGCFPSLFSPLASMFSGQFEAGFVSALLRKFPIVGQVVGQPSRARKSAISSWSIGISLCTVSQTICMLTPE